MEMSDLQTPKEWAEARAQLVYRLRTIELEMTTLRKEITHQNELITELKLRVGTLAAGIAAAVSILTWLATHFGFGKGD